jgi:hypothetical protein
MGAGARVLSTCRVTVRRLKKFELKPSNNDRGMVSLCLFSSFKLPFHMRNSTTSKNFVRIQCTGTFLGPGTIYGPKAQKIVLIVIDELKDAIHLHASVGSGSRSPLWCQTDPSGVKLNLQSGLCDENVSSD